MVIACEIALLLECISFKATSASAAAAAVDNNNNYITFVANRFWQQKSKY